MKTENLDALLLDQALGQLGPEVTELLDEHLMQNPAAAARAASLRATVSLARNAVGLPPSTVSRSVNASERTSLRGFTAARRTVWRREAGREMLKIAACVAFGLWVGWAARAPAVKREEIVRTETLRMTPTQLETPAATFWSRERLEAEMRHPPRQRPPLAWPLKQPQRPEDKS